MVQSQPLNFWRSIMETYEFSHSFELGSMLVSPVYVRIEQLRPIIAAHRHANTSYEIHYTERGQGAVTIDGVTRSIGPGTLYITGPGVLHTQRSDLASPIVEYCLYLNCQLSPHAEPDGFKQFLDTIFWMGNDTLGVFPLLHRLIEENRAPQPGVREMSDCLLKQIIILLVRMYRRDAVPAQTDGHAPLLTRAGLMPIIEDAFFYRYRTLTLGSLASLLNLSVRQTQRLLQRNFGKTFTQKLNEARMSAAIQFLINSENTITGISDELGFSSIEHFSAAFKRFVGCSPRQYRCLHRTGEHGSDH